MSDSSLCSSLAGHAENSLGNNVALDLIGPGVNRTGESKEISFEPIVETAVDPAVIGGLVIRIGDEIHDGSIKTQLKTLRNRLQQRSLHEIQSGRDRFSHPEGD